MSKDVLEPLNTVLMSGYITQGKQVEKFEEELIIFLILLLWTNIADKSLKT